MSGSFELPWWYVRRMCAVKPISLLSAQSSLSLMFLCDDILTLQLFNVISIYWKLSLMFLSKLNQTKIWKFSWIINIPSFQLNSFKLNSHTIEVWKCHNICWFIWIDLQVVVCVWFVDCRTLFTHHRNKIHVIYVSANQKWECLLLQSTHLKFFRT